MRVAITGATGLIGGALAEYLRNDGLDVLRLVRRPAAGVTELRWDPAKPDGGLAAGALDGVDAVVHLSGAPIASRRWTPARKQELRASRVDSSAALIRAMLAAPAPPPVLLAASAVGWYGNTAGHAVDESAPSGAGFLPTLVRDWEAGHRAGARGRHPGRQPALRHRAIKARRIAWPTAAPLPTRSWRQDRYRYAVRELDHADRPPPGHAIPACSRTCPGPSISPPRRQRPMRTSPGRWPGQCTGQRSCRCQPQWSGSLSASCRPSCSAVPGSSRPGSKPRASPSSIRPSGPP